MKIILKKEKWGIELVGIRNILIRCYGCLLVFLVEIILDKWVKYFDLWDWRVVWWFKNGGYFFSWFMVFL